MSTTLVKVNNKIWVINTALVTQPFLEAVAAVNLVGDTPIILNHEASMALNLVLEDTETYIIE